VAVAVAITVALEKLRQQRNCIAGPGSVFAFLSRSGDPDFSGPSSVGTDDHFRVARRNLHI
jgi:hypothetical protein